MLMSFHTNVIIFALILSGWCGYVNTAHKPQPQATPQEVATFFDRVLTNERTQAQCDQTDWLCLVAWAENENTNQKRARP